MVHYSHAISLIGLHKELTDDKIEEYQLNADDFFMKWKELTGRSG